VKNARDGSGPDGDPRRPGLYLDRASVATVTRLSSFYRVLQEFERDGIETISSKGLAERCAVNPAQVRKDLSIFGNFGRRGLGYNVRQLRGELGGILGLGRTWCVALVGAGNLGHALFAYKGFQLQGFAILHVFDVDAGKVGQVWGQVRIQHLSELKQVAAREPIDIAIVAVPAAAAHEVTAAVVAAGIRGILNFTPGQITTPDTVAVRNVDLSIAMESLSYALVKK
jgi:redox-sensing transcriptional repressor